MSNEFGFSKKRFASNFPKLYDSPEKQSQSTMDKVTAPPSTQLENLSLSDASSNETEHVTIRISYQCSDPAGESINTWPSTNHTIDFEAPEAQFSGILRTALQQEVRSQQQLIEDLKKSGREMHMYPAIEFGDWRDLYLKPDPRGVFNFEVVSDLVFDFMDGLIIPIVVNVVMRPLGSEVDTFLMPNSDQYMAIGLQDSDDSDPDGDSESDVMSYLDDDSIITGLPLDKSQTVHLIKHSNGSLEPCTVEFWPFGRRRLGDIQDRKILKQFEPPGSPFPHFEEKDAEELEECIKTKIEKLGKDKMAAFKMMSNWVPQVPNISFQLHEEDEALLTGEPKVMPVAIHLANHLHLGQEVILPTTACLPVKEDTKPSVFCNNLRRYLERHKDQDEQCKNLPYLLSDEIKERWNFDLWVMPQGEEKLRFWWSGGLEQFLSEDHVKDDDFRLYVEAHLVPVKTSVDNAELRNLSEGSKTRGADHPTVKDTARELSDSERSEGPKRSDNHGERDVHEKREVSKEPLKPKRPNGTRDHHEGDEQDEPWQYNLVAEEDDLMGKTFRIETTFCFVNSQHSWSSRKEAISLDSTVFDLIDVVKRHYSEARESDPDFMQSLEQHQQHLRHSFHITFPPKNGKLDERNDYVSDDLNHVRIYHLRDLFSKRNIVRKGPMIPVRAHIEIVPIDQRQVSTPEYKYHRYGTLPLAGNEDAGTRHSTHLPMRRALLARYEASDPVSWKPVKAVFRKVNGNLVGRLIGHLPKEDPQQQSERSEARFPPGVRFVETYDDIEEVLPHRREDYITRNIIRNISADATEVNVPILPNFTFLPLVKEPDTSPSRKDVDEIHLAIHIEHHLHQILEGRSLSLPLNVLVKVTRCHVDTYEELQDKIIIELEKGIQGHPQGSLNQSFLFDDDIESLWKMDFWVLPQSAKMPKLREYLPPGKGSPLEYFLDKDMYNGGNKTMYMEAHLVLDPEPHQPDTRPAKSD